jgi:biopolymer transport protein ExbB/TolQ
MFGNQLWYLVMQSDAVCKFVLLILLAMSVLCWTIFFGKLIIFRIKNKHFTSAYKKMLLVKNVPELIVYTNDLINTAPGYLLAKNLTYLHELTAHTPDQALHKYDWELLEKHCESSIETMILQLHLC